jgi:23S rRNA (guanosine2251-2'-O)-methyltransferase
MPGSDRHPGWQRRGQHRAGQARPGQRGSGRDLGGEQVEGRQAVRELLAAGRRRVREVWMASGNDDAPILSDIAHLAERGRVPVRIVSRQRLEAAARTDAPQGVLARAEPLTETDLAELLERRDGTPPFLLVLDGITDPYNLGALLRSAEVAGATGAVLPRHRSALIGPAAAKASAGAIEHLPLSVVPGIPAALATAAQGGVWTIGLDPTSPHRLWDLELASEPVALVIGGEGRGLSRLTRQRCDQVVAIPKRGAIASLNAAAAGALACFEVARRRS